MTQKVDINEQRRLEALRRYRILDTPPEKSFDDLTELAASICQTPIAFLSFIDEARQWFKSRIGLEPSETPLDIAICHHAILQREMLEIPDTWNDERVSSNPLVRNAPRMRFYASAQLVTPEGLSIGTLGVADTVPRTLTDVQKQTLRTLAGEVVAQLELRRHIHELQQTREGLQRERDFVSTILDVAESLVIVGDGEGRILRFNRACERLTGRPFEEVAGKPFWEVLPPENEREQHRAIFERSRTGRGVGIYENHWVDRTGTPRLISWRNASVLDDEGRVLFTIGTGIDVTESRRAEERLREREERFRALVEHSAEGLVLIDAQGVIVEVGASTERLTGFAAETLIGSQLLELAVTEDVTRLEQMIEMVVSRSGTSAAIELRIRNADGRNRWADFVITNLLDVSAVEAVVINFRDSTTRKEFELQIEHQAFHDGLTGLPNRLLFAQRLEQALAHARRSGTRLAVLFLDLDRFKVLNDTFGHSFGDEVLAGVAERLQTVVRDEDCLSRAGGDEFMLFIEETVDVHHGTRVGSRILHLLEPPFVIQGHSLHLTASVGVSLFPEDGDSAEDLIRNADAAMYRAKEAGRNTIQMFTASMNERSRRRLELENDLRFALDRGELSLVYQPIFHCGTRSISSVEALLRWNHPQRGLISPDAFIHIAEDTRLIVPIGEWVLRTAATQVADWRRMMRANLRLAVNVSARQLQQGEPGRSLSAILEHSELPGEALELEVTESIAMQNIEAITEVLTQLKSHGVTIAIDDFGTGQTSLIYLRRLPIDTIKIDRLFIRHLTTDAADAAIVSAVISLSQSLHMNVVAEGVETQEQVDILTNKGCNFLQGYHLGRPLPPDQMTRLLSSSTRG